MFAAPLIVILVLKHEQSHIIKQQFTSKSLPLLRTHNAGPKSPSLGRAAQAHQGHVTLCTLQERGVPELVGRGVPVLVALVQTSK